MLLSWGRLPGVRGTGELGAWDGAKSSRRRARGAVAGSASRASRVRRYARPLRTRRGTGDTGTLNDFVGLVPRAHIHVEGHIQYCKCPGASPHGTQLTLRTVSRGGFGSARMPHTPLGTAGSSLSRVVLPPILAPGWRRLRLESMDHCRPLSLLPTHARRGPSPRFLFEHASHAAAHGTDMRKGTHIQCTAGAGPQHEPTPLPWRPPRTMRSGQEERRVEQSAVRDDAAHQRLSCAIRVNNLCGRPIGQPQRLRRRRQWRRTACCCSA